MKYVLCIALASLTACSSPPPSEPATPAAASTPTSITVTSTSPEAVSHFKKGEELFDNLRTTEAAAEFAQALTLDPNFVLARAYHGLATPGAAGLAEVEAAAAAASTLPEAERLLVEGAAASRRGEVARAATAFARASELAPGDWRGHFVRGQQLLNSQKYTEAVLALKKATELNPKAGGALNMLGYAALRQGDADAAIAAFEQYVKVMPNEPNPQDSLGEALLGAGRFKDAEAAFQKALTISPGFWAAHEGTAYAKAYAGDIDGARKAFAAARTAATEPTDRVQIDDELGALALAQRDPKTALAIYAGIEKTAGVSPADLAFVPLRKAAVLNLSGRYREALVPVTAALATADDGKVAPGLARNLRRQALVARITAEAGLRDGEAAGRSSAALDQAAAAAPDSPSAQSAMHYGQGMLAVAKGDAAGARAHFQQCSPEDELCKWQGVLSAEKAGDVAGAALARDQVLKTYNRDPLHLVMRSHLAAAATR